MIPPLELDAALVRRIEQAQDQYRRRMAIKNLSASDIVARSDVESMSPESANQNRPRHWRASSNSCHCGSTRAPCWVCEQSAECVECGSIELMDEMEVSKHGYMCSLCDDARRVL